MKNKMPIEPKMVGQASMSHGIKCENMAEFLYCGIVYCLAYIIIPIANIPHFSTQTTFITYYQETRKT